MANDKFMIDGVRTMSGWEEYAEGKVGIEAEFGKYCKPGDFVSEDVYDYFLNLMPPIYLKRSYLQVGGEISAAFNRKTQKIEGTYMTFVSTQSKGIYKFLGYCFLESKEDVSVYVYYKSVNEFLKKTYVDRGVLQGLRPKIVCRDGFTLSVQAGDFCDCTPRCNGNDVDYITCEVGYPSEEEELLLPFKSFKDEISTEAIYSYTPVSVIEDVIKKHGGFFIATPQYV